MKKRLLLLSCLFAVNTLMAIPAWNGARKTITLTDGTRLECRLVGDEFGHCYLSPDGRRLLPSAQCDTLYRYATADELQLMEQQAAERRQGSPRRAPLTGFPTTGEVRGLVILTEFQDVQFQSDYNLELYQRQMNESGYNDYNATGSARDYFIAQSDSIFIPQFDVVGPIRLPSPESTYGRNSGGNAGQDSNPALMVKQACEMAHDSLGVDFSNYDFDDNGEVDFVFILYAGYGENYGALSTTIWPHMSWLNMQYTYLTLDGKSINRYACSCELSGNNGTNLDGIGAFCHEFGHVLGLPDIYNTNYSSNVQLGPWDIMDSGSYNNTSRTPCSYTAFERYSLGWLDLIELNEPADTILVPEINASRVAYRISTDDPDEFFTLENHQQQGWDLYQPGKGLMIIHIDYDESYWNGNSVNSGMYPHYDLMEADGRQGSPFDTDLYPIPSNDLFTDYSSPNSLSWDGKPTEKGVSRIRQEENGDITFAFMRDRLKRPVWLDATQLTDTSFVANWTVSDEADCYRLHVVEQLPDSLNPLYLDLDGTEIPDGWSGNEVEVVDGFLRLGAYGVSGTLKSPIVTLQPDTTSLTLCFDARSYPGKSVNYDVTLTDAQGNILSKESFKGTRNVDCHLITYTNCPEQVQLTIESKKERLFLDDLRLVAGIRDTAEIWDISANEWTFDGITDTQYLISGLVANRNYICDVTAVCLENESRNSAVSDTMTVKTLPEGESGIEEIGADAPSSANRTYDMMGRPVSTTTRGLLLVGGKMVYLQ